MHEGSGGARWLYSDSGKYVWSVRGLLKFKVRQQNINFTFLARWWTNLVWRYQRSLVSGSDLDRVDGVQTVSGKVQLSQSGEFVLDNVPIVTPNGDVIVPSLSLKVIKKRKKRNPVKVIFPFLHKCMNLWYTYP